MGVREEINRLRVGQPPVEQESSQEENDLEALIGHREEADARRVAQFIHESSRQLQLPELTRIGQVRRRSQSPYRRLFQQEQNRRSERALLEEMRQQQQEEERRRQQERRRMREARNSVMRDIRAAIKRERKIEKELEVITADSWAAIDEETCSICFAEIKEGDKIYKLACDHTFHKACFDPWLMKSSECPNCRGDVYRKPDPKPEK